MENDDTKSSKKRSRQASLKSNDEESTHSNHAIDLLDNPQQFESLHIESDDEDVQPEKRRRRRKSIA